MKQIQRGAALLTVLALLCTLTLPAAAASDTVTIATVQDLIDFSKQCTRDTWSQGITVELTADLDLSGSDFTPVPIFQGTFHGNSHTISGFSFEKKGSKTGLFRTLTASAVVEDLTVEGDLAPQGSASQAGLLVGENYGTVSRCAAQGSVSGQEDIGGLVGLNGESGCHSVLHQRCRCHRRDQRGRHYRAEPGHGGEQLQHRRNQHPGRPGDSHQCGRYRWPVPRDHPGLHQLRRGRLSARGLQHGRHRGSSVWGDLQLLQHRSHPGP